MAKQLTINEIEISEKRIGSGSFGNVYFAIWKTVDKEKKIAAKEITLSEIDDRTKKTIKIEVYHLSLTTHENIVKCFGFNQDNFNRFYILMEYADCGSLFDLLHKRNITNFSFRAIQNWMLQCALGMEYLHGKKILHRNLKTQNLLLTDEYLTLKIGDFGSVKKLKAINTSPFIFDIGTVYSAPELFQTGYYDEKCDVYSFGIVLWEVLSRRKPFYHLKGISSIILMYKIIEGERPFLQDIKPYKNSGHLKQLIDECFDSNPKHRPTMQRLVFVLGIDPDSIEPYIQKPFLQLKPLPRASEVDFIVEE